MLYLKSKAILVFVFILFTFSITFTGRYYASEIENEIWELKLTGDTEGIFEIKIKRVKNEKGLNEISGKFSGPMTDRIFGRGEMICRLNGQIEHEAFSAKISGFAEVTMGMVSISGTLRGTVLESSGVGSWKIIHDWGSPEGKWVIKKIRPSK
jgi:hypothetical protein